MVADSFPSFRGVFSLAHVESRATIRQFLVGSFPSQVAYLGVFFSDGSTYGTQTDKGLTFPLSLPPELTIRQCSSPVLTTAFSFMKSRTAVESRHRLIDPLSTFSR